MNRAVLATGGVLAATSGLFIVLAHHRRARQLAVGHTRNLVAVALQAPPARDASVIRHEDFIIAYKAKILEAWHAKLTTLTGRANLSEDDDELIANWFESDRDGELPNNFWTCSIEQSSKCNTLTALNAHMDEIIRSRIST